MSRKPGSQTGRPRSRSSARRPNLPQKRALLFEGLEKRELLAGGLPYQLIDSSKTVEIYPSGQPVDFSGSDAGSTASLLSFFNAPNGSAPATTFSGSMTVGGETVSGSFTLSEISDSGGLDAQVGQASLTFGSGAGVQLSSSSGAFELLPSGAAGTLNAGGSADSVSVSGLPGLNLSTTAAGLTFEVNETGSPVDVSVGSTKIDIAAASALDVSGPAAFRISKDQAPLALIGGQFSMTLDTQGGLALSGSEVSVDLYAGSTRAVSLGSASADFSLDPSGFSLSPSSFTVGSFALLPSGLPADPGSGSYPSSALSASASLGPITLEQVAPTLPLLSFGPSGLSIAVGVSAASASLSFGSSGASPDSGDSSAGASATNLAGAFEIAGTVDPSSGAVSALGAPGAFSLTADSFSLNVPRLLTASASGLAITYDPSQSGPQQILSANKVSVEVPALHLTGEFQPSDANPALVVSTNGFAFGQGTVTYNGDISLGSHLTITDPYVTLTDFQLHTGASTQVSLGGFTVGAAALALSATSNLQATGKNVSGSVSFDPSGAVSSVTFAAGSLTANLGKYVTLSGKSITFDPTASGSETVLSADSLSASVDISAVGLSLSGTATNISLSADGTVTGPSSLVVDASFNSDTISQSLKLPPVLTLDVSSVEVDFPHFDTDPTNFTITISASVNSSIGPVKLSGSVDSLVVDPNLLADGQFPITSIAGVSVSASGNLFGGTISGALVAGVIKTDATGQVVPDDTPNPAHTTFWGGVEGSFKFANFGASIYVGFSQYGLISAYLDASAPIILDPDSGLELLGFRGGVSFNALPLPVPTDPGQLSAPPSSPPARSPSTSGKTRSSRTPSTRPPPPAASTRSISTRPPSSRNSIPAPSPPPIPSPSRVRATATPSPTLRRTPPSPPSRTTTPSGSSRTARMSSSSTRTAPAISTSPAPSSPSPTRPPPTSA